MTDVLNGLEPAATALVVALLNTLWQGVIIFAIVWLTLHLIRIVNATTRYAIWLASLVFVLLLPLLNLGLPLWYNVSKENPGQLELKRSKEISFESDPVVVSRPRESVPDPSTAPEIASFAPKQMSAYEVVSLDDVQKTTSLFPMHIGLGDWAAYLLLGWLMMALFMVLRIVWSYRFLNRLKRNSEPVPLRLEKRLESWRSLSNSTRSIELRCSNEIKGPVAAGLTQPAILLPCQLVEGLSEEELDQVGLHEMAHICRWDDWTNLLQKLVEAVFFFHPAIHWIGGQLDVEREIACDDWVIYRTRRPKPYAACLTRLIELTGRVKAPELAPGGFTTKKQIARRIEMSLKQTHPTKPRISKLSLLVGIFVLTAAGVHSARMLPLVAAQEEKEAAIEAPKAPHVETSSEESMAAIEAPEASQAETTLEESMAEVPAVDEEQVTGEQESQQAEEETEERLRAEAEERSRLAAIREQEAIERRRARQAEIEEKLLAEAEERRHLMAIQEHETLEQRRAVEAELMALEGKEHMYREMLSRTAEQERALMLAETEAPEAFLLSEARPFGLLDGRKATLPEGELIELMTGIASNDPDHEVRKAAIRSIGSLGTEQAADALMRIYDSQDDVGLKKTILSSLGWSQKSNTRILNKLENIASSDPNPELRKAALLGLAGLPGDDGVSALISIYDHTQEKDLKKFIIRYLSQGRSDEALEKLKDIARTDADASLRLEAVQSLGSVHGRPRIGYADVPVFAEPYVHAVPMPVPAPEPPRPPAPPKKKNN